VSTQNSLDTLKGDVAAVKRALGQVSSPAILVGHSCAGTVITHTYEAESSHVPMLSKPSLVIDVIRAAARSVQESTAPRPRSGPSEQ
jgi:hypothetical protein